MTTLPCAIYEDVSPTSPYVYYFFEAKKTDDFGFLGWAQYNISREEGDIRQPIKTGFYCIPNERVLPLIMPEEVLIIWESIPKNISKEYSHRAEIDEHEMRIYKDEELRLTLTK